MRSQLHAPKRINVRASDPRRNHVEIGKPEPFNLIEIELSIWIGRISRVRVETKIGRRQFALLPLTLDRETGGAVTAPSLLLQDQLDRGVAVRHHAKLE